jgi:WD40 repeat protein
VVPEGDQIALIRGNSWEFWEIEQQQQTATGPIWTATKKPLPSGSPTSDVNTLALSPDGSILALGNREGLVTLIHVPSWKVRTSFRVGTVEEPDSNVITDLSFMPGNQSLLAVVGRREISIWDLNKQPIRYLSLPVDNPSSTPVVWGPKGHELFVIEEDKRIVNWNLQRIGSKIEELGLK